MFTYLLTYSLLTRELDLCRYSAFRHIGQDNVCIIIIISSSFNLSKMAQYKIKQCIKAIWANR